ncbi:MAG: biopolymer transporter ExbD [Desulfovibrio sp.]|jgi:biopolymer transport protein ExbD|nr:biopolymer transporter ExbD [Desulfovibrio sp.]
MYSSFSEDEGPDVSMDLTPLIDAVFMLLIFFIMAATFAGPVLEVALAQADAASAEKTAGEKLTITITDEGAVFFGDEPVGQEEVPARLEGLPKQTPIVFNVDKEAPFGVFVRVLDAAKCQDRSDFIINSAYPEGRRR